MAGHARRLDGIPPTVFAEMSALAVRSGALNLGQGFPDVDGPPAVIERAVTALRSGRNQYAPGPGIPELRGAIARHQARHYGLELDPDREVVVTTGATEGIAAALLGLVDPGDEVVVLEPYYDSYLAMIAFAGGVRRPVTLRAPDFRLDVDELRAAVTNRTRVLLINTPHNPTGTVLNRQELQAIADIAIERDLVVITDEVYEHLTFDDLGHVPLCTLPGKSFSITGGKIGWATGPADLVAAVNGAKQWLSFTSGSPLQPAIAHALDHEWRFYEELATSLQQRRDQLCAGLSTLGVDVHVPEGTYFALTDVRELGWADGRDFCLALPERAGVVAIPAQAFYDTDAGHQLVRWAFCKEPEVIAEGLIRLQGADLQA